MVWYCLDGDFFEQVDKLTAQVATVDAVTDHRHDDDDSNNVVHARHVTTSPRRSSTATSLSSSYLRRRASSSSSSSSTTSPTPSQHNHYRRRGSTHHQPLSPGSPPLSLEEYQREQEMEVPDTVASKALYFLHHVDPHKFTNAVIGINAGMNGRLLNQDEDGDDSNYDDGDVVDDGWMNGCIFTHYVC
jgi:hypothetical protein